MSDDDSTLVVTPPISYLDFDIEIRPGTGREYPISITRSPGGESDGILNFPFDDLELERRKNALELALLRCSGNRRQALTTDEQVVQDFGQALFNALMVGDVRSSFDLSKHEADLQGRGLRLRLYIKPPELAALPWEFLFDPRWGDYLSLSKWTPVVRYLNLTYPVKPFKVSLPLQILGMSARPYDLPDTGIEEEKERLDLAIQPLQSRGLVKLTWLEGQTWRDLHQAMSGGPWHIFHFIGHGGFDSEEDEGFIVLVDEEHRGMHRFSARELARLLASHLSLRLVILNSCEGGKGSQRDIYSSVASVLVQRHIPAAIGMQYEISDHAAIEFSRSFYDYLARGFPVDAAVTEARVSISLKRRKTVEWGTPVLYMHVPDGILFNIIEETKRTIDQEAANRLAAEKAAQEEADLLTREKAAQEQAERLKKEKAAKEEADRLAREKAAKEEAERIVQDKADKAEVERLANEKAAQAEAERIKREKATKEEADRLAREKTAKEEAERILQDKADKAEAERLANEKAAQAEAERIKREKTIKEEAERQAREKATREETERQAKAQAEQKAKDKLNRQLADLVSQLSQAEAILNWDQAIELGGKILKLIADKSVGDDTSARIRTAQAYIARSTLYLQKNEHDLAIADIGEAIKLEPSKSTHYTCRAQTYYQKNDYIRATSDYDQAIRINSKSSDLYLGRGKCYKQQDKHVQAIADLTRALQLGSTDAECYAVRGFSYSRIEQYDLGLVDYNQAIKREPKVAKHYSGRGFCYFMKEDYQNALADFNRAVELNPKDAIFYTQRSGVYNEFKDYTQAIAELTHAIRLYDSNPDYYSWRAWDYYCLGQYQNAISDCTQAIKLNPKKAEYYNLRGLCHLAAPQSLLSTSLNLFTTTKGSSSGWFTPTSRFDYFNLLKKNQPLYNPKTFSIKPDGKTSFPSKKPTSFPNLSATQSPSLIIALSDFNHAIELDPNIGQYYANRGVCFNNKGDYTKAIADYTQAIKLEPDNADFYVLRGQSQNNLCEKNTLLVSSMQSRQAAIKDFEKAISLGHPGAKAELNKLKGKF